MSSNQVLRETLQTVGSRGVACVRGIPVEMDQLEYFAQRVGPVKETNWGRVTDVKNMPNPYDLTVTTRSLSAHADNPYRHPAPGYIFMHCIKNSASGGVSTLIDGFHAAEKLRKDDPEAFQDLTTIQPNFTHIDYSAILNDTGPLIQTDERGDITRIRFSNRTEQIPPLSPDILNRYYRARKAFARYIFSEEFTVNIKLTPGDGFIWDNYRILHGRTAFDESTGMRHMRHCYMDRDTLSSRFKCLLRDAAPE